METFAVIASAISITMIFCIPNDQEKIEYFKKPICIEKKIGTDSIKKCYELKEVKNVSK